MYFVYAIKSEVKNYIYVGMASDLEGRFSRHNHGYERTTRSYRPFRLILQESFATRAEARKREKYLKSGIGKEFLKSIS
jgi:putative endonuclease